MMQVASKDAAIFALIDRVNAARIAYHYGGPPGCSEWIFSAEGEAANRVLGGLLDELWAVKIPEMAEGRRAVAVCMAADYQPAGDASDRAVAGLLRMLHVENAEEVWMQ